MKILLDTCIPQSLRAVLIDAGYEVEHCSDWDPDPGDSAILDYAAANNLVLVTLDKDFGELAVRFKRGHHGLLRLESMPFSHMATQILLALKSFGTELHSGCYIVVTAGGCRVWRP